ncbi:methyl-accepting chemotaxis protein [Palleronia aestuarii]|uniref:Methyl-accepting chemotaxis protein n=1 Tax=Palleronia aestuarii TaxID=568105 RepID=A0A2W7MU65_9RHOB|nr:methyl-accepting chemotaxis protein [Palleronia aestuarii]PZX11370.1 methyl-accepting chemotaxis protein [Palleronia aestuarii]
MGAEQINTAIRELDRVIQENADTAITSRETSGSLMRQCRDLRDLLTTLRGDEDSKTGNPDVSSDPGRGPTRLSLVASAG